MKVANETAGGAIPSAVLGSERRLRPDIQGLRGIAILVVVLYHAGLWLPGGFTGVDVFFVISGFVITGVLLRELVETGRTNLRGFYARRVRRLLPGLTVMLGVVSLVAIGAASIGVQRLTWRTGTAASVFSANALLFHQQGNYFALGPGADPFLNTWTLAVEEQFYIFFPALLFMAWLIGRKFRAPRWTAAVAIALVSAVSFALCIVLSRGEPLLRRPQWFAFYSSPTRAWEFGVGAVLALASPLLARAPRALLAGAGVLGLVLVVVAVTTVHGMDGYPGLAALLPVLGAAALLVSGSTGSFATRAVGIPPLVWLGNLSYSWYLWHYPLIVLARIMWPQTAHVAALAAAFSLAPAWLSVRFVENPIRFHPRQYRTGALGLAVACVGASLLASACLAASSRVLSHETRIEPWAAAQALHLDETAGCDSRVPLDQRQPGHCTWRASKSRGLVVLVGDSNAGHFTEPIVSAAAREGYDTIVATASSCPLVAVRLQTTAGFDRSCWTFVEGTLRALVRLHPALVITAARTDYYLDRSSGYGLAAATGGAVTHDRIRMAQLWSDGLEQVLQSLSAHRIPALVVHPIPVVPYVETQCPVARILLEACVTRTGRLSALAALRNSLRVEDNAVARVRSAHALDLSSSLCDPQWCYIVRRGVVLYRDQYHLSVAGTRTLAGRFMRAIVAARVASGR